MVGRTDPSWVSLISVQISRRAASLLTAVSSAQARSAPKRPQSQHRSSIGRTRDCIVSLQRRGRPHQHDSVDRALRSLRSTITMTDGRTGAAVVWCRQNSSVRRILTASDFTGHLCSANPANMPIFITYQLHRQWASECQSRTLHRGRDEKHSVTVLTFRERTLLHHNGLPDFAQKNRSAENSASCGRTVRVGVKDGIRRKLCGCDSLGRYAHSVLVGIAVPLLLVCKWLAC